MEMPTGYLECVGCVLIDLGYPVDLVCEEKVPHAAKRYQSLDHRVDHGWQDPHWHSEGVEECERREGKTGIDSLLDQDVHHHRQHECKAGCRGYKRSCDGVRTDDS